MALTRYEPFDLFRRLSEQLEALGAALPMDEESNVVTSSWRPAVDIKEEADKFVILADVPGVDPKNIEVTMDNGIITIKGERAEEKEEERGGYRRVERSRGSFYRRFSLPDTADAEHIAARTANGVLEITIPKREAVRPRRIDVRS